MKKAVGEMSDFQIAKLLEDNEKIQKELHKVREENRKLKHIISYGNISKNSNGNTVDGL